MGNILDMASGLPCLMAVDAVKSVRDILRTIAQCHSRHVLIRDVKPENFLYLTKDHDAPLKAIDFGLAMYCKPEQTLQDRAGMLALLHFLFQVFMNLAMLRFWS